MPPLSSPSPLPPQSRGERGVDSIELWIAGDASDVYAEEAKRCRELATRLGVADRIRWLGSVDDLPALYRQADVLVMPSIHEGLGIPVLEAQASGVPVVAARSTALVETVGEGGILFAPDDVDDFVRALREALTPAVAEHLRRLGEERVAGWSRPDWRREFGVFVERLLDAEPAPRRRAVRLRSMTSHLTAEVGMRSVAVPLAIENVGDVPIDSDRALSLQVETCDEATGVRSTTTCELRLDEPIAAGGQGRAVAAFVGPARVGRYALSLTPADGPPLDVPLTMSVMREDGLSQWLALADAAIAAAEAHHSLPNDYVDVCEGLFGPVKRWLKRKLLGNFKVGYVDVAYRQQSEVNRRLVDAVRQLAECCRSLERRSHIAPGLPGTDLFPEGSSRTDSEEVVHPVGVTADPGKPGAI